MPPEHSTTVPELPRRHLCLSPLASQSRLPLLSQRGESAHIVMVRTEACHSSPLAVTSCASQGQQQEGQQTWARLAAALARLRAATPERGGVPSLGPDALFVCSEEGVGESLRAVRLRLHTC